jgi:hypothetical protein
MAEAQADIAQGAEEVGELPATNGIFDEEPGDEFRAPLGEMRIGRVVSVAGSQVMLLLENHSAEGTLDLPTDLQIGALVKMYTLNSTVFGMVSGLSIPIPSQDPNEAEMSMVELELVGEALKREDGSEETFQGGVSFCPSLGNAVYTSTHDDLKHVYARPAVSSVKIGTISIRTRRCRPLSPRMTCWESTSRFWAPPVRGSLAP